MNGKENRKRFLKIENKYTEKKLTRRDSKQQGNDKKKKKLNMKEQKIEKSLSTHPSRRPFSRGQIQDNPNARSSPPVWDKS